jgi:hypothetical protein
VSNLPIFVAPPNLRLPSAPPSPPSAFESTELLNQLVELQREQVALARAAAAAADNQTRWKNFLGRWRDEFPNIGQACKEVLPVIERTYLRIIQELADRLRGEDADDLDNEYVLAEFLDRYGMRLTQLGAIVGQLSPIADATPPATEPATEESEPQ